MQLDCYQARSHGLVVKAERLKVQIPVGTVFWMEWM